MTRALALVCLLGCSHGTGGDPPGGQDTPDAAAPPVDARPFAPAVVESAELCKLLSNRNTSDPTPNDVQHKANVLGADLGIPVATASSFYLLFGDTIGYAAIWPGNESHPDSVGYALDSAAMIAAQPGLLCNRLGIVALPASQSAGPGADPSVQADFAGAAMIAPNGHALGEYIHNPAGPTGQSAFPQLPGDFEVPSGAFAVNGSIYVFYTTVVGPSDITMAGSYLAKWTQPATSGAFGYQVLYAVDERFDANGPLHGNFINIAAEVAGDYVYLFGTGAYRRSGIHVARKLVSELDTPGGFEELGEIVATPGYGELSVHYYAPLGQWMLLAEELTPVSNRIVAYFAERPDGPWSAPLVVHDMADPQFRGDYCCTSEDNCLGKQMFNCNRTGFYGTYLFPAVASDAHAFTVTYTMSSFSPYNVALFQTTFSR
jgi:hypothetical protein